jgi:predicted amino acid racemase
MPFLDRTIEKNPRLVETGVRLHQEGRIPANTLLLDLDVITSNAALIKSEAARVGLRLYFMTKQYGRNPVVTNAVLGDSDAKTASVDIQCAKALHYNGFPLGNVGNLSQVPESDLPVVVGQMQPEVITVFSIEKAASVSRAAVDAGRSQDLLIRVRRDSDAVFPGMDGGIELDDLATAADAITGMPAVRIVGVTTFPAISYSTVTAPEATTNFETMLEAKRVLERAGVEVSQVNAPGNTCLSNLEYLAEQGATHVEPGSALTGHTTFNLGYTDSPEIPGAVWITEVSHFVHGQAWVYGGGFFLDDPPVAELSDIREHRSALVGHDADRITKRKFRFLGTGPAHGGTFGGIDYHGLVDVSEADAAVGDTVVFGFRTQAFMTRAVVGVVSHDGSPTLQGLFDVQGHRLDVDRRW